MWTTNFSLGEIRPWPPAFVASVLPLDHGPHGREQTTPILILTLIFYKGTSLECEELCCKTS